MILTVAASKGGVGKSSIVANLAGTAADSGYVVLVVDLDVDTGLGIDFGYFGQPEKDDQGAGLRSSLQQLTVPDPVREIRPNLDVLPGGHFLKDLETLVPGWLELGVDPRTVLRLVLRPMQQSYDLIVVDTAPGEAFARDLAFAATDYVLIPTRSDESSLAGVGGVAASFESVRDVNPDLTLAGVVVFGVNPQAVRIAGRLRERLQRGLGGAAPVFEQAVRYQEATAVAARGAGLTVSEYEQLVLRKAPKFWEEGGREVRGLATRAPGLATDYARLTVEVMGHLRALEGERAARRISA